jgi:FkbM family methyltransferase
MNPLFQTRVRIDHLFRAQFGEDRVLWEVFRHQCSGFFIEVGAYDGMTLSNTFFLEQMGWHGILIEPILALCHKAAQSRPRSRIIHAACSKRGSSGTAKFTITENVPVLSFLNADAEHVERCKREGAKLVETQVPVVTLDHVLMHERREAPAELKPWASNSGWRIDLVSIDTEGCELDVLDGFSLERFKPRVLVIENDRPSGQSIEAYLADRGYRKFHRQKINDFYVRRDISSDELNLNIPGTV